MRDNASSERRRVSFTERLTAAAKAKNYTQSDVARVAKVSRAVAHNWFKGTIPQGDNLFNLAVGLDVRDAWLLGRDNGSPHRASEHPKSFVPPAFAGRYKAVAARELATTANNLSEEIRRVLMTLRDDMISMCDAWMALPENERDEFRRAIEAKAAQYRSPKGIKVRKTIATPRMRNGVSDGKRAK